MRNTFKLLREVESGEYWAIESFLTSDGIRSRVIPLNEKNEHKARAKVAHLDSCMREFKI